MIRHLFLFAFLIVLSGCGYTTGSMLPSNYRNISIEPFTNGVSFVSENSRPLYVPQLETKARTAIINRFQFDGNLRISESGKADLILKGELVGFERDELRLTENQDVQEYRVRILVSLTMIDAVTNEVIWSESSFGGEATYFTSGPQATSESGALENALTDLGRRVVERTIENW